MKWFVQEYSLSFLLYFIRRISSLGIDKVSILEFNTAAFTYQLVLLMIIQCFFSRRFYVARLRY